MNIVIVGAGVVGQSLAEQLSQEGHRIAIVDRDRTRLRELGEKLDILCVQGNAGSPSVLDRAGLRKAEMAIAVTDVDEVNIVVGMLAARYGVKHRIARIRNQEYVAPGTRLPLRELGIDHVINPDHSIVDSLVQTIRIPGAYHIATLAGGQLVILRFVIPADSPAAGATLAEFRARSQVEAFLVLDIVRHDQVLIPQGSSTLQLGDTIHLLCAASQAHLVPRLIHATPPVVDTVIIGGASRMGVQLAAAIQGTLGRVTLIEPDATLAEEAAAQLGQTAVLRGDPAALDVLEEAALERCDLFCALADDEQQNIMSSLVVKKHSRALAGVLVHQPEYLPVLESLGIELLINPRQVTVGEILMHVRQGHVQSVTRLLRGRAELLELEVPDASPAVRAPLKKLEFPKNALLGAILHNGTVTIPNGDSRMEAGDQVVVFALPEAIPRIEKLFTRRRWF